MLKRLKTLWLLSGLDLSENKITITENKVTVEEKPKMAQIIKRTTPVKEFLNEE